MEAATTRVERGVAQQLVNHERTVSNWMGGLLVISGTVALSLDELGLENVPETHSFEISNPKHI